MLQDRRLYAFWSANPDSISVSSSATVPVAIGEWHHHAMTRVEDGDLIFYCDGEQLGATRQFTQTVASRAAAVSLGVDDFDAGSVHTRGRLDEARRLVATHSSALALPSTMKPAAPVTPTIKSLPPDTTMIARPAEALIAP